MISSSLPFLLSSFGLGKQKLFTFLLDSSSSSSTVASRVSPADSSMVHSEPVPLLHLCGAGGIGVEVLKLQSSQTMPESVDVFLSLSTITFRACPGDITRRDFARILIDIFFFLGAALTPTFFLLVPINSHLLFLGVLTLFGEKSSSS